MKLICLVKFVPDVDNFKYDYENNTLIRENVRMLLNPDDACAVAFALKVKAQHPQATIEVVTMAPTSVRPHLEDLMRLGVDQGTLISDKVFVGSDTYVTSKVLASYLQDVKADCYLTGTHAIDGDTSHIPSQIAYALGLNQMSGIVKIDEQSIVEGKALIDVETEVAVTTYAMTMPAVLSITRESKYKLPYPTRKALSTDVSDRVVIIGNEQLGFDPMEVGLKGSPTRVVKTYTKEFQQKGSILVKVDDHGIDTVYNFLRDRRYL